MTREEAIKALGLMEHVESIVATYEPGEIREDTTVRELKEACRIAVSALRAQQSTAKLDRSRWEGCEYCLEDKDLMTLTLDVPDEVEIPSDRVGFRWNEEPRYCPICGKPLTEEAWAELERRIGGNDGTTG